MAARLVLVEFPGEADAVLRYLSDRKIPASDCLFIGLEPSVRAHLEGRGITASDTLPYFDNDSHARVLRKSAELLAHTRRNLVIDLDDGMSEAYLGTFIYYAHLYLNLFLRTIEVLDGIHRHHPKATLVVPSGQGGGHQPGPPLIEPRDRFLATLAGKHCQGYGIPVELVPVPDESSEGRRGGTLGRHGYLPVLDWLLARCYDAALRIQSRSPSVVASTLTYNLDRLLYSVNDRFPQVKPLAVEARRTSRWSEAKYAASWLGRQMLRREPRARLRMIPVGLIADSLRNGREARHLRSLETVVGAFLTDHNEHFQHHDVSFGEEFASKVTRGLIPYLAELSVISRAQSHVLSALRPHLVVSPFSVGAHRTLGTACQENRIPAMVIPQKTLVEPRNELEAIEETAIGQAQLNSQYPLAAAQSPLALRYMEYTGYPGRSVSTGPLIFSRFGRAQREEARRRFFESMGGPGHVVLYAPSMKSRRSSRLHVVETLDEVLSSMDDVVQAVSALEDAYLVLRLHPGAALKQSEIETLLEVPSNVKISSEGTFADTLALADMLVSYSSTCTEEAMQNDVPVVLYDKWNRYNHLEAPQVRNGVPEALSPAYYVTSKAQLSRTLRWVLDAHANTPELPASLLGRYVFSPDHSQNFYDLVGSLVERPR